VKRTDRYPFTPLNKVCLSLLLFFTTLEGIQVFVDISSTEFYPRRAKNIENSQYLIYFLR